MKKDRSLHRRWMLATVTLGMMLWLDLGCAPKPVVPSGFRRVTINSEEAIANYHEHVARTLEERQGRSVWQRQLELLTQQVSELRGVVTYLQLKQQESERMRSGIIKETIKEPTDGISPRTIRLSRTVPQERPITDDTWAGPPEQRADEQNGRREPSARLKEQRVGTRAGEAAWARHWHDAVQRLSGIDQSGSESAESTTLVRVKPLADPVAASDAPRPRTEAARIFDEVRSPMVTWLNAREKLEVRNHAVIFRARPHEGVTEFTPSRASQAYLKKAATHSPFMEVRSYSDGAEGNQPVDEITRTRAEVVRSYLVALGVPAMNIDLKLYPLVAHDAMGHDIPVRSRRVEIEFIVRDPSQVYPAWNERRG